MGTLSWGILSTGAIARAFARGLARSRNGVLVAVASRTQESADRFGDEFQVPAEARYAGYGALLEDPNVQAVYIAPPHPLHAEWTIRAAESGKHILCEKPMTLNYWQAAAVLEAVRRNNVFFMEAFMYRCHPQTANLIELVRSGEIGEVRTIQATFSFHAGYDPASRVFSNDLGGGGILDVGCYTTSISRLIAGAALGTDFADPVEVRGFGKLTPTGVDAYAVGILKFQGDIFAQISTGVELDQENVVRVFGSKGRIIVPNPYVYDRSQGGVDKIIVQKYNERAATELVTATDVTSFTLEADVVAEAVAAGRFEAASPAMTWDDSLGNMRTLDQWRSAIGQTYAQENFGHPRAALTVAGRALSVRPDAPMKYGEIAGLTRRVSRLVMGVDNQTEFRHAQVMFDDWFEKGGNAFDTGWVYGGGACERRLGEWVRSRGLREHVVILEKGAHTPFCTPEHLTRQLHESLDRLQMDCVDIYMMHRDNLDVPVGEFIDILNEHVVAGRMSVFGGSNWSIERVKKANAYAKRKGLIGFSAVSNNLSLARMIAPVWDGCIAVSDPESREWLRKTQTPLMPWSSQARGFFTERARPDTTDEELRRCWFSEGNWQRRARAAELAERKGVQPIQIALAYVLCQPFPTFALVGPRSPAETRSSLGALSIELTPGEMKWLDLGE